MNKCCTFNPRIKALYRLAQAHRGLKEFKKAVEFVAKALAVIRQLDERDEL